MDGIVFHDVFHFARAATFVLLNSAFVTEFSCILAYNQCCVYAQVTEENKRFQSKLDIFSRQFHVTERATGPCLVDVDAEFQVHVLWSAWTWTGACKHETAL